MVTYKWLLLPTSKSQEHLGLRRLRVEDANLWIVEL